MNKIDTRKNRVREDIKIKNPRYDRNAYRKNHQRKKYGEER